MSIRTEKVASVIQEALAEPLREFSGEHQAGMLTVTAVKVSPDLQIAKVYLSIFRPKIAPEKVIQKLEDEAGKFRAAIGRQVRLRYTPDLKFFIDDTLDQMDRIQVLLDKAKENSRNSGEEKNNEDEE